MNDFDFVDPRSTPFVEPRSRGELPHLYKEGGTYFVTFRLWDAVELGSKEGQPRRLHHKSLHHKGLGHKGLGYKGLGYNQPIPCGAGVPPASAENVEPRAIVESSAPPLRMGSCLLAQPPVADLVQNALRHFDSQRYRLLAWCVLPNHVHVVFQPLGDHSPSQILHSWKSFTAHKVNKILGRSGPVWERESFDHLVRSVEHLERFIDYLEANPVEAGLCKVPSDWLWSSARFKGRCGAGVPPAGSSNAAGTAAPQENEF